MNRNENLEKTSNELLLLYISDIKDSPVLGEKAFLEFYKRYKDIVWGACNSICDRLIETKGIEDLSQEVFTTVYERAETFKTSGCKNDEDIVKRIKSWLFSIALNQYRDWIRQEDKKLTKEELAKFYLPRTELNHESLVKRSEESKIFDEAWNELDPREQNILRTTYLYYDPNKDNNRLPSHIVEDLASYHGTNKPYIRKIRQRALTKLEKACQELTQN